MYYILTPYLLEFVKVVGILSINIIIIISLSIANVNASGVTEDKMGQSRNENILENMLGAQNPLGDPQSREEALLMQILEQGGGGGHTDVTGTLNAGSTSITLTDESITTDSTVDIYTDTFGVNPTDATVSTGSITLTFEEQSNDLGVKVRITS
jgi:hypothetical protein